MYDSKPCGSGCKGKHFLRLAKTLCEVFGKWPEISRFRGKSARNLGKWSSMERQPLASQWYFSGIFRKIPLPLHPESPVYGLFGPRGAQKAPSDRKYSPHRPTPASDLPDLP